MLSCKNFKKLKTYTNTVTVFSIFFSLFCLFAVFQYLEFPSPPSLSRLETAGTWDAHVFKIKPKKFPLTASERDFRNLHRLINISFPLSCNYLVHKQTGVQCINNQQARDTKRQFRQDRYQQCSPECPKNCMHLTLYELLTNLQRYLSKGSSQGVACL